MFTFDITKWVPDFILADKNGYAIAKALEAGLRYLNETVSESIKLITDFDSMPEWRLDELAWEINCLYDYHADADTKREWIKRAFPLYRLYGTPEAIYQYVGSYFDNIKVEESWEYDGLPFHFRVMVDGVWNPANEAWARKAIDASKNIRSVLDDLAIGCTNYLAFTGEGEVLARFVYPLTGPEFYSGTWPHENYIGVLDKAGRIGTNGEAKGYRYPYPLAGTRPDINTLGATNNNNIQSTQAEDSYYEIPYKLCGMDEI